MGNDRNTAPSNRIVMAGIGIGNMGRGDQGSFLGRSDVQYVAMCDVKRDVREWSRNRVNEKYGTRTAKRTRISARLWPAMILTRFIVRRRTTGTRS